MVIDVSTEAEAAAEVGDRRRTRSSSIDLTVNSPIRRWISFSVGTHDKI